MMARSPQGRRMDALSEINCEIGERIEAAFFTGPNYVE